MKDLARVVAAVLALVFLARSAGVAGDAPVGAATAVAALVVVVALVLAMDGVVTAAAAVLLAHYGLALGVGHVSVDYGAPVMVALLLAFVDVSDVAVAVPAGSVVDRSFLVARLARLGSLAWVGVAASVAVFGVALLPWPGGAALRLLGVLAGAGAVVMAYVLARRAT